VLKELGFTSDEIAGLRASGAAQAAHAAVPAHAPGKPI